MKLAVKLALSLSIGVLVVHVAAAGYRVYRENALFRADIGRDARVLGRALSFAAELAWETGGETEVLALLDITTARREHTQVRWVLPDGAGERAPVMPDVAKLSLATRELTTVSHDADQPALLTYVPVQLAPGVEGVLEITDSMIDERHYIYNSVATAAATVLVLVSLCAAIAWWLSARFIHEPIQLLISRARGVGEGDLGNRVEISGSEELEALAMELNRMCDGLEAASLRADAEAEARAMATEQLRHADRLATIGSLASSVAHELGTPINVVDGHTQLIREVGVSPVVETHLDLIEQQCRRMTSIIRQWLDFARRGRQEEAACDVTTVIEETLLMLRPMAKGSKVSVDFRCCAGCPQAAIGAGALQQVILNLAMNAIQAMTGGGKLEIDVNHRAASPGSRDDPMVHIRVRDNGEGMTPDIVERIFEPFFTTKLPGKGTGLGLPIAAGIVQDSGGRLDVQSTPGSGTLFDVFIPTWPPQ